MHYKVDLLPLRKFSHKRDIEDNSDFAFRSWRIYPIKAQSEADMGRLF